MPSRVSTRGREHWEGALSEVEREYPPQGKLNQPVCSSQKSAALDAAVQARAAWFGRAIGYFGQFRSADIVANREAGRFYFCPVPIGTSLLSFSPRTREKACPVKRGTAIFLCLAGQFCPKCPKNFGTILLSFSLRKVETTWPETTLLVLSHNTETA